MSVPTLKILFNTGAALRSAIMSASTDYAKKKICSPHFVNCCGNVLRGTRDEVGILVLFSRKKKLQPAEWQVVRCAICAAGNGVSFLFSHCEAYCEI